MAKKKDFKKIVLELLEFGATTENIAKYLNIDEKHVAWIIEQSKKNEKSWVNNFDGGLSNKTYFNIQ